MSGNQGLTRRPLQHVLLVLLLAIICSLPTQISANDAIISSYAPNDDCTIVEETDAIIGYRCPGVFDVDVWFSIGDARWTVSFHKDKPTGPVLKQSFTRPHHPDLRVEWRFEGNRPMAALQLWRFYDEAGELDEGAWVITKIDGDNVCHIGFVDILENEDALAVAREIADSTALFFSCDDDPTWIGNPPQISDHMHNTVR